MKIIRLLSAIFALLFTASAFGQSIEVLTPKDWDFGDSHLGTEFVTVLKVSDFPDGINLFFNTEIRESNGKQVVNLRFSCSDGLSITSYEATLDVLTNLNKKMCPYTHPFSIVMKYSVLDEAILLYVPHDAWFVVYALPLYEFWAYTEGFWLPTLK